LTQSRRSGNPFYGAMPFVAKNAAVAAVVIGARSAEFHGAEILVRPWHGARRPRTVLRSSSVIDRAAVKSANTASWRL
jgi:hypothetical protein